MNKFTGRKAGQFKINRIIAYIIFFLGIISTIISVFNASSVIAFIGLGFILWGAILLYITPSRYIPLELLKASVVSTLINIEKILADSKVNVKGVYIPPKYLEDFESSLIFIPLKAIEYLPTPEEIDEKKLYSKNPNGIFLTPPGLALSKLFEKELETSFIKTDLTYLQEILPKLLIEDMEIAETMDIKIDNNKIIIEITNHIFTEVCQETRKLQKTHEIVGCPLSSAIACALAKATGKPIRIEKEEQKEKITKIQFELVEE